VEANNLVPGGIRPYGGIEGEGKVKIDGQWYPALTCSGYLELKLRGSVGVVVPVRAILLLDPTGAGAAFNTWVDTWPKKVRNLLDDLAYLDASIGASVQTKTPIGLSAGRLYLDLQNGLYGLGTDLKIKGHVGVSVLYIEGKLGGGGTCWFRSTSQGDTFDHAEYTIEGEVLVGFFQWERSFWVDYTVTVPDGAAPMPAGLESAKSRKVDTGMKLVSRDYASRPGSGRFVLGVQDVRKRMLNQSLPGPLGVIRSETFVEDVFPNTTASLAGNATNSATVLFSYDNTNLIQVQAMDIYFTRWNGSSWSPPAPVATNTQTELHPAVALDSSNRPVAAWMRMRDPNYTDSTNVARYLSQFDIVASAYTVSNNAWLSPVVISSNQCLNYEPRLARAPSGALAAWWHSNPSNQLEGDVVSSNNAPTQWWWARWDAAQSRFTNSVAIDTNVVGALSPTMVYGGTNAWLFWAQDQDLDYSTSNDTALCSRYWNGSAWGSNVIVTSTGQAVMSVQAVMLTNGTPLAVWWQNGDLVYANGANLSSVKTARADSGDLTSQRLNLVASPDNRYVVLVFPLTTSNGMNLAYRVYDTRADVWGGDFAFESTNTLDFSLAPTFVGGQMWSAYARGILAYSSRVVNVGTTNIVLSNLPYRVRTDLMLAKFELDADVAAVGVDVPASYPPVIRVTVANEGDTVVSNLVVEVREGSAAGAIVASLTASAVLAPHSTDTLVLPWTTSGESSTRVLVAILDPANALSEFRETNNSVSNRVLQTALEISSLVRERGEGQANIWIVQARNPIARVISNATARLRLDTTNGAILASTATNLPAYQTMELRLPLAYSGLTTNNLIVTELFAPPAVGETNAAQVFLATPWSPDTEQVPAMPTGLHFLRPGLSNSLPMGWTAPTNAHDGVRVVRTVGTNVPEEIGFTEIPLAVFSDGQAGALTQLSYRVAAYNGMAVGPLSASISTNFLAPDANGDGLPDAWQTQYFPSAGHSNAAWAADSDEDGYENWQEYLFGSIPSSGSDYPRVLIRPDGSGSARIGWMGAGGQPYSVEFSATVTGFGANVLSTVVASNGLNEVLDPAGGGASSGRFYRVTTP
jgi:hypothetical protein